MNARAAHAPSPPAPDPAIAPIAEALGGREVTRVFVHGIPRALLVRHIGMHPECVRYSERALLMARPWDVVCVQGRPDPDYLDELGRLGLGAPAERIVSVPADGAGTTPLAEALVRSEAALRRIADLVAGARAVELDPYLLRAADLELARSLEERAGAAVGLPCRNPGVIAEAERKDRVRALALGLGVPVAEGEVVRLARGAGAADVAPLRRAVAGWQDRTGRVIVRGALGGSGSATYLFGRDGGSDEAAWQGIARNAENDTWLVEALHPLRASPNLMVHVSPGAGPILRLVATDQRLDAALAHRGNVYPSTSGRLAETERSARRVAAALQARGYGGTIGFDFCEPLEPSLEPFLAEVNPRVNAALYPAAVLERLAQAAGERPPPRAFASATLRTAARSFTTLERLLRGALFDPAQGSGTVVSNAGGLASGHVGIVVLDPSRDGALRGLAEVAARLGDRGSAVSTGAGETESEVEAPASSGGRRVGAECR